jgi:alpha-mannosidase
MKKRLFFGGILTFLLICIRLTAQPVPAAGDSPRYDLSKEPVLYTVGYAHLDTQWRWDYPETINQYIKATLDDNFKFLDKYKDYVFNFTGARRYKMMKEYYPEKYEKLKKYIAQNRWFVSGSSVDECDANIPSPESVIRHVLYGNQYFRNEFGKESVDFILPDCFGFQASLPSVLAHCGVKGFSTQKLVWGSAVGIPFNIGNWRGPDGKSILAALNATDYGGNIDPGLDTAKYWVDRVMDNGKKYGVFADFRYYGTGDIGGAPEESSIKNGIASQRSENGKIHVYLSSSDQIFRDLNDEQAKALPEYSGDLLLTQHSAGSLTSEGYMKRWNRKNELMAQASEPLAVTADWLGSISYPKDIFYRSWWLLLGSQMHDILPGTCIPKAYEYAWNDEVLTMNQFAALEQSSAGGVIRALDTRAQGKSVVVYNPLAIAREDVAEAEIQFPEGAPENVQVFGPDGKEVLAQLLDKTKYSVHILFVASVPSFGMASFDIRPVKKAPEVKAMVAATNNVLDNEYYKVTINAAGDVSSIIDKKLVKELLSAPARLAFLKEHPERWPAWNMDWNDRKNPPAGYVDGPAKITLIESGPVRVAYKIERTAMNSVFMQIIRVSTGEAGKRIEFVNTIKWQSKGVSLKASFPLTAANSVATYNLGLGTIERANNNEKKYEVPSREWFDLTDKSGSFGVTIAEDCKFGSDKPDDKTLRLTLLYTPVTNIYHDQATQDWGTHEMKYALYSHKGDWRAGRSEWQGRMLNQPLRAFQVSSHPGALGTTFSMLKVSTPQVDVRAMKKAETGDMTIVRMQELTGKEIENVELTFPGKIKSVYEIDGQERKIKDLALQNGKLLLGFGKFELKSIAVQIESPAEKLAAITSIPIALTYDEDVASTDKKMKDGKFTPGGYSYPAELLPDKLTVDGVQFKFGFTADGLKNVVACKGEKIPLPKTGNFNKVYILAAAVKDTNGLFRTGDLKKSLRVQAYTGKIGQFDKRTWDKFDRLSGLETGYIKRDEVAWFASHVHGDSTNQPYQFCYIYKYELDAGPASGYIQLPDNDAIKVFSITAAYDPYDEIQPSMPLYDDFTDREGLQLTLAKRYASDNAEQLADVKAERKNNLNDLPYKVSLKDYADMHEPNGITSQYFYSGTEKLPNMLAQGLSLPGLTDGMFDLLPSDTANDLWFEKGEGRIVMDLQKQIDIDSLHLFTNVNLKRGVQYFTVWGYDKDKTPATTGDPKSGGWTYICTITPLEAWSKSKAVWSVTTKKGKTARFRYLMMVTEDCGHGPYFLREVDVFEK